ncbi:DnaD domain protein [Lentibacillus lipolyticus]|nr:DnaD domain protein [Lentibacillus lipolyticus]
MADVGEELVLDAMQRALERGKSNWSYVKGILQAWVEKGITTVEDAKAEETAFRRSRDQGRRTYAARTEEVIPDWFHERKRQEKRGQEQKQAEKGSLPARKNPLNEDSLYLLNHLFQSNPGFREVINRIDMYHFGSFDIMNRHALFFCDGHKFPGISC